MDITQERWDQTEAKLKALMPQIRIDRLEGDYAIAPASLRDPSALALIFDGADWSALKKSTGGAKALGPLAVFSIRFPLGCQNSGFVGWFAKLIKEQTGTGAIVVCGLEKGEIFDYYAVPIEIAEDVHSLINRCQAGEFPEDRRMTLSGDYEVTQIDELSEIGPQTRFHLSTDGHLVSGSYVGGQIASGELVGKWMDADTIHFRYIQASTEGRLNSGSSTLKVKSLPHGGIALEEYYTYANGGKGVNRLKKISA